MSEGGTGKLVLLVEDNEDNRAIYSTILEHGGFGVEDCESGEDALEKAVRLTPDVVLLDISLPGMDGWTVARQLREDPATRDAVIVALTAHAHPDMAARARAAGCDSYLLKPLRANMVLERVTRLLAERSGTDPPGPGVEQADP